MLQRKSITAHESSYKFMQNRFQQNDEIANSSSRTLLFPCFRLRALFLCPSLSLCLFKLFATFCLLYQCLDYYQIDCFSLIFKVTVRRSLRNGLPFNLQCYHQCFEKHYSFESSVIQSNIYFTCNDPFIRTIIQ